MEFIKFEKNMCASCKTMGTLLKSKGIEPEVVNLEDNPEMAVLYKISTVPTLIVLDGDDEIFRMRYSDMGDRIKTAEELWKNGLR